MSESQHQKAFFKWVRKSRNRYPELKNFFAVPNGVWIPGDKRRSFAIINKQKAEGLESGVPDTFMLYPNEQYSGLVIEFKVGNNKPEGKQLEWLKRLANANFKCVVAYSWESAKEETLKYIKNLD